jgi:hypothetical protein
MNLRRLSLVGPIACSRPPMHLQSIEFSHCISFQKKTWYARSGDNLTNCIQYGNGGTADSCDSSTTHNDLCQFQFASSAVVGL